MTNKPKTQSTQDTSNRFNAIFFKNYDGTTTFKIITRDQYNRMMGKEQGFCKLLEFSVYLIENTLQEVKNENHQITAKEAYQRRDEQNQ